MITLFKSFAIIIVSLQYSLIFSFNHNSDGITNKVKGGSTVFIDAHSIGTRMVATNSEQDLSTVSVTFKASKRACTDPLPLSSPKQSIDEFFQQNRDLLFSAGATVREIEHPDDELMDLFWRESQAGRVRNHLPPRDETAITRIIEVYNPAMQFLGIKLHSVVIVGTQLLKGHDSEGNIIPSRSYVGCPEFQFTLLGSRFSAEGPRPLVWLFNKITRRNQSTDADESASHPENIRSIVTRGFTRIWSEVVADGKIIFCTDARLESQINIPRLLTRLLPMSLEKMEEKGSKTLQKAIEKDIAPAMERCSKAYQEWALIMESNV